MQVPIFLSVVARPHSFVPLPLTPCRENHYIPGVKPEGHPKRARGRMLEGDHWGTVLAGQIERPLIIIDEKSAKTGPRN